MEVLCQKSVCIFSLSLSLSLSSVTWGSLSTSGNKVITIGAPVGPNSTAFPTVPLGSIKDIGSYLYEFYLGKVLKVLDCIYMSDYQLFM